MRSHFASPERQELVDDDLRAVGEIAELRLPDHQRLRVGEAVAVFEADHRGFRQRAVDDLERRLALADVVDRDVARFGLLIDQHRVAMRERAAAAVLAGQPDMRALGAQRADRQRLGGRPVDALAGSRSRRASPRAAGRSCGSGESPRAPSRARARPRAASRAATAGVAAAVVDRAPVRARPRRLRASPPCSGGSSSAASNWVSRSATNSARHRFDLGLAQHALGDEPLGIELPRRRMARDRAVHQRLREGRLVALVMAVAAIAEQVDDDVLA